MSNMLEAKGINFAYPSVNVLSNVGSGQNLVVYVVG
jgi:hypothetical protein